MGGMDPQLVGAPGLWFEMNAGDAIFHCQFSPAGDANLAMDFVVDLVGSVVDIEAEGKGDGSFLRCNFAIEESLVDFLRLVVLKLNGEIAVGFRGEGQNEEPRGVHVEPMNRRVVDATGDC